MHSGSPFISKYGGWRGRKTSREIVKEKEEAEKEREGGETQWGVD